METEIMATTAISDRIARTEYLLPCINSGDREPSFDGFIYAYREKEKRKDQMIGRAAIQVKGRRKKSNSFNTFCMEKADLENYRAAGGALLFVVLIDEKFEKSLYYSALTPFYINQRLRVSDYRKGKVKLQLLPLPDNDNDLCNLVINFIRDCDKQSIVKNGHIWTYEEVEKQFGKENIEMNITYTGIGYDKNNPFSFLSKNPIYLYAQNKEGTITIPLEYIEHANMQVQKKVAQISVGNVQYEENIEFLQDDTGREVFSIGKSIQFINEKKGSMFCYNLTGNLDERIKAIETVIEIVSLKYICIDSVRVNIKISQNDLVSFDLQERKEQLKFFKDLKETLNLLNIKKALEVDNISEKDEKNIHMLVDAIKHGRQVSLNGKGEISPVSVIHLSNLRIVLTFIKNKNDKYTVGDFFKTNMTFLLDNKPEYPTTPFALLSKDDYLYDDNLVLEIVVNSFKQFDNYGHMQKTMRCILEIIKAYDTDKNKKELLTAAKELSYWMVEKNPGEFAVKINYLQCIIRERNLNDEEENELFEMLNETSDYVLRAGIYILLKSKEMAKKTIEMLEDSVKREFESFPIYELYKNL